VDKGWNGRGICCRRRCHCVHAASSPESLLLHLVTALASAILGPLYNTM
jgi:hypothetical protein